MKNRHNKMRFVFLLFATISVGAVYFFLWHTTVRKGADTALLSAKILEEERKLNDSASLKKAVRAVEDKREELSKHFLGGDNVIPSLEFFETLGRESVTDFSISDVMVDKSIGNRLVISFTAIGQFENVYLFLKKIESAPYQISFKNISLSDQTIPATEKIPEHKAWNMSGSIIVESFIYKTP